jgi:hypothetical protein
MGAGASGIDLQPDWTFFWTDDGRWEGRDYAVEVR